MILIIDIILQNQSDLTIFWSSGFFVCFRFYPIGRNRILCQPCGNYLCKLWWWMFTAGTLINASNQIFPTMPTFGANLLDFFFFFFCLNKHRFVTWFAIMWWSRVHGRSANRKACLFLWYEYLGKTCLNVHQPTVICSYSSSIIYSLRVLAYKKILKCCREIYFSSKAQLVLPQLAFY